MLQIIGWLGCLYLIVKGFEISASAAFRDDTGKARFGATTACMLAWGGAVVFGIWLADQGSAFPQAATAPSSPDDLSARITAQCIELAKTPEAAAECVK